MPDDPSVLFTTAGMQQFKPYYTGAADAMHDFGSLSVASIQKCVRTSDIDEVGDERHLTFFEMLGNFSFGGYFKKEAIQYGYDFIIKEMGLKIDYVTVFEGWKSTGLWLIKPDEESKKIWKSLGLNDEQIKTGGFDDNFWGPTGEDGPCGPTTEIYVNGIEVWNIVFNEYYKSKYPEDKNDYKPLQSKGIDTGMGLERLAMVSQKVPTVFEADLLKPILTLTPSELEMRVRRIIADHSRAIAFMIADGIRPSNKEQGYVLRRLMRRVITYNFIAKTDISLMHPERGREGSQRTSTSYGMHDIFAKILEIYGSYYKELNADLIISEFEHENEKFMQTLKSGLKELEKVENVDASSAFMLYESFGLPYEIIKELGGAKAVSLNRKDFDIKFKEHQEKSRAGAEKKFGGHGLVLDTGELKAGNEEELKKVTRLHTATHLLQTALRKVLGPSTDGEVTQAGSDITAERLRFDFSFSRKLTPEEIKKVEDLVNEKIKEDLPVSFVELPKSEAEKTGALYFFKQKYPDKVKVYFVGSSVESAWSKEFCGGPHVSHTDEIGRFKISKEEAVSAGVRRIRATIE
ncbi:MAG: Alanine-tRNA ligase, partial [Candidatus Yanofskybacteria bacterium GW2011_GWC2_41_9]